MDKSLLRVIVSDNSRKQEVIDFLSPIYNVEIKSKGIKSSEVDLIVFTDRDNVSFTDSEEELYFMYSSSKPKLAFGNSARVLSYYFGATTLKNVENHMEGRELSTSTGASIVSTTPLDSLLYPFEMKESSYSVIMWSKFFKETRYTLRDGRVISEPCSEFLEAETVLFKDYNSLLTLAEFKSMDKRYKDHLLHHLREVFRTSE